MSKLEIIEISKLPKKKLTLITGFAGVGFIGNTVLMHMAHTKGLRQIAYLHGDIIPPLMVFYDGKPRPCFRIYTDASEEFLLMITEALISSEAAWIIGKELMKWLSNTELKEIIAIDGVPLSQMGRNIFGFTTGGRDLPNYGIQNLPSGAISGINAAMLYEAEKKNIAWTSIFIPSQIISGTDYQGAVTAINLLNKMFNLNIDSEQLQRISDITLRAEAKRRQEKKGGFLNRIFPG
jgi:predicted ATP-grasp superfamily ATP-dependent carboligase